MMDFEKWDALDHFISAKNVVKARLDKSIHMSLHHLHLKLQLSNVKLHEQVTNHYQHCLQNKPNTDSLKINWVDPSELGITDDLWNLDANPNCRQKQIEGYNLVIQRDFIAFHDTHNNEYFFTARYILDDGLFNFIRWMMPRYLISKNKLLLHSSCIVIHEKAYFALGPSGAGKTTLATLSDPHIVLGDDMNVISIEDNKLYAVAGAVGQRIENPKLFGKKYPLGGLFWLDQAQECYLSELKDSQKKMFLLRSIANIFWDNLNPIELEKVFKITQFIIKNSTFKQLHFQKIPEVWERVLPKQDL
ncbi:MAG: hypothetical protein HOO06_08010 [Bdellovibrionaceae bacterium]|jgi:hypothetical protein|nr:hypothetical protein [Pseudobdellovibrionaceae bacterium]